MPYRTPTGEPPTILRKATIRDNLTIEGELEFGLINHQIVFAADELEPNDIVTFDGAIRLTNFQDTYGVDMLECSLELPTSQFLLIIPFATGVGNSERTYLTQGRLWHPADPGWTDVPEISAISRTAGTIATAAPTLTGNQGNVSPNGWLFWTGAWHFYFDLWLETDIQDQVTPRVTVDVAMNINIVKGAS